MKHTVAVDFDGVLHSYTTPWVNARTIPDPPVEGAIEWLGEMVKKFDVVIHTTRGATVGGVTAVRHWLRENGFDESKVRSVTDVKVPAIIYIDDRAYRFIGPGSFPSAEHILELRAWNK